MHDSTIDVVCIAMPRRNFQIVVSCKFPSLHLILQSLDDWVRETLKIKGLFSDLLKMIVAKEIVRS